MHICISKTINNVYTYFAYMQQVAWDRSPKLKRKKKQEHMHIPILTTKKEGTDTVTVMQQEKCVHMIIVKPMKVSDLDASKQYVCNQI